MSSPGSACPDLGQNRPRDQPWRHCLDPPGEKHWYGASPRTGMVHLAIQEVLDGSHVTWMEHVTDEQYDVAREA